MDNPGQSKRLTMGQIAKLAGTSRSTVSRVLAKSSRISESTRRRVEEVIKQYNFRPNVFARGLRGGRTGQVAVLGRWMQRGFIADVIQGIDDVAGKHDVHILVSFAHGADDYTALWRRFAPGGEVDGIILIAPPAPIFGERVEPGFVPTLLCACEAMKSRKGWQGCDAVTLDNAGAMEHLMNHLAEHGCRRFLHLTGAGDNYDARVRAEFFEEYVNQHPGLAGEIMRVKETLADTRAAIVEYARTHPELPEAFVCFNDDMALGVMDGLKSVGVPVPGKAAVTGFDDATFAVSFGLTTVGVPGILVGQECARLLFERMGEGEALPVARNALIQLSPLLRTSSLLGK